MSFKKTVELCKSIGEKKIHMSYTKKMCINMWIMWITISREGVLQLLQCLRPPQLSTNHPVYNFPEDNFLFRQRWKSIHKEFPDFESVPADLRKRFLNYRFHGLHKYLQEQRDQQESMHEQTHVGEPLFLCKYEAEIHTRFLYVDNFQLHGEWLQFLQDGEHNLQ